MEQLVHVLRGWNDRRQPIAELASQPSVVVDDVHIQEGQIIPQNVKIMSMLRSDVEVNNVFLTRTDSIPVPKQTLPNPVTPMDLETTEDKINLYHSDDWMRLLVQDIHLKNSKAEVNKGPLIRAMEEGRSFEIGFPKRNMGNHRGRAQGSNVRYWLFWT